MSKRLRNIVILLVSLLVLIGANIALYIMQSETDENTDENQLIYISNYSVGSVSKIKIENEHGELVLVPKDGVWYVEGDEDIELDQGLVSEAAYMLTHITGIREVSESEDETNLYGMLTPAAVITTYHDGVLEQSFIIGDNAPIEGEYYLQSSVYKKVYTVDSDYYAYTDIRAEDLMTVSGINIEHADMKRIDIVNTLGEQYSIQRTADDNNISLCYWEFIEPFNHDADTGVLYGAEDYNGMITYITQLTGEKVLGYADDDNGAYGQDRPIFTAAIYGYLNEYQSLTIGDYGDEDNYSIIFSDDNIIYSVAKDRVPFINYSAYYTAEANLNLINIDSVEKISIDLPDLKTQMSIERYALKNADGTEYKDEYGNAVYRADIDVEGLDDSASANIYEQKILFYQYITAIKIDDLILEGPEAGEYIGNIVFDLQSVYRDTYTIEFYEYSKSHYIAKKNGENAVYLVNIKSIEDLAYRYQLLLSAQLD